MFYKKINILGCFFIILFFTSPNLGAVDEFDINLLNEKMNRLEQELSDIQKSLYAPSDNTTVKEQEKPVSSKYQRRLNKLENDFSKLNGQLEEIFFRLDQLQEQLSKFSSDIDFRLSKKDGNFSEALPLSKRDRSGEPDTYAYPKNTSEVDATGGDVEILGTIDQKQEIDESIEIARNFQNPDDLFNYGKDSLQNLNYDEAESAFRGFVKKYPDDQKTPSAYYWLGESLFVRENYPEAVLAYGEVIKKHKKHQKAPASLLKIGMSFSSLEKKKESCDALNKVLKQYPDSDRDILKKTNFIIQENNC